MYSGICPKDSKLPFQMDLLLKLFLHWSIDGKLHLVLFFVVVALLTDWCGVLQSTHRRRLAKKKMHFGKFRSRHRAFVQVGGLSNAHNFGEFQGKRFGNPNILVNVSKVFRGLWCIVVVH